MNARCVKYTKNSNIGQSWKRKFQLVLIGAETVNHTGKGIAVECSKSLMKFMWFVDKETYFLGCYYLLSQ